MSTFTQMFRGAEMGLGLGSVTPAPSVCGNRLARGLSTLGRVQSGPGQGAAPTLLDEVTEGGVVQRRELGTQYGHGRLRVSRQGQKRSQRRDSAGAARKGSGRSSASQNEMETPLRRE